MLIKRDVYFSAIDQETGEERLFSVSEILSEEEYLERLYSDSDEKKKKLSFNDKINLASVKMIPKKKECEALADYWSDDEEKQKKGKKYMTKQSLAVGGVLGAGMGTASGALMAGKKGAAIGSLAGAAVGAVGGLAGAHIGSAVAGKKGAGIGAAAGAVIGGTVGRFAGKKIKESTEKDADKKITRYKKASEKDKKYLREKEEKDLDRRIQERQARAQERIAWNTL